MPEIPVRFIAIVFTILVFLCATQDIAVDGWAVSLLTEENITFASTAQSIGLNTGYLLSYSIFLALQDATFANKYIRSVPKDAGLVSLGDYLFFWGVIYLVCTIGLLVFTTHDPIEDEEETIGSVYVTIRNIITVPHMQEFIMVHLVCKIGWQTSEAVFGLKLLDAGFPQEYISLGSFIDFPMELVFGYLAAKWSSGNKPLSPWSWGFMGRLLVAFLGMFIVSSFRPGASTGHIIFIMAFNVFASFSRF
jgi:PAT family acetyl-CoA transporter-like MFS transporter 1